MNLEQHIKSLLYQCDCVIVPDLGAFLAQHEGVSIDYVQGRIHPPAKRIIFNASLTEDADNLLRLHICQQERLMPDNADARLSFFAEEVRERLSRQEIVNLEGIGKLFATPQGNIQFTPEADNNFAPQTFGLPVLRFYPILRGQAAAGSTSTTIDTSSSTMKTWNIPTRRVLAVAAAIVCLLGLPLVIRSLNHSSTDQVQSANLTPSLNQNAGKDEDSNTVAANTNTPSTTNEDIPMADRLAADDEDNIAEAADQTPDQSEAENKKMMEKFIAEEDATAQSYVILVGSFSKSFNANGLSKRLLKDGYTPFTDMQGKFKRIGVRVSCAEKELAKHLAFLRKSYNKGAWVMK